MSSISLLSQQDGQDGDIDVDMPLIQPHRDENNQTQNITQAVLNTFDSSIIHPRSISLEPPSNDQSGGRYSQSISTMANPAFSQRELQLIAAYARSHDDFTGSRWSELFAAFSTNEIISAINTLSQGALANNPDNPNSPHPMSSSSNDSCPRNPGNPGNPEVNAKIRGNNGNNHMNGGIGEEKETFEDSTAGPQITWSGIWYSYNLIKDDSYIPDSPDNPTTQSSPSSTLAPNNPNTPPQSSKKPAKKPKKPKKDKKIKKKSPAPKKMKKKSLKSSTPPPKVEIFERLAEAVKIKISGEESENSGEGSEKLSEYKYLNIDPFNAMQRLEQKQDDFLNEIIPSNPDSPDSPDNPPDNTGGIGKSEKKIKISVDDKEQKKEKKETGGKITAKVLKKRLTWKFSPQCLKACRVLNKYFLSLSLQREAQTNANDYISSSSSSSSSSGISSHPDNPDNPDNPERGSSEGISLSSILNSPDNPTTPNNPDNPTSPNNPDENLDLEEALKHMYLVWAADWRWLPSPDTSKRSHKHRIFPPKQELAKVRMWMKKAKANQYMCQLSKKELIAYNRAKQIEHHLIYNPNDPNDPSSPSSPAVVLPINMDSNPANPDNIPVLVPDNNPAQSGPQGQSNPNNPNKLEDEGTQDEVMRDRRKVGSGCAPPLALTSGLVIKYITHCMEEANLATSASPVSDPTHPLNAASPSALSPKGGENAHLPLSSPSAQATATASLSPTGRGRRKKRRKNVSRASGASGASDAAGALSVAHGGGAASRAHLDLGDVHTPATQHTFSPSLSQAHSPIPLYSSSYQEISLPRLKHEEGEEQEQEQEEYMGMIGGMELLKSETNNKKRNRQSDSFLRRNSSASSSSDDSHAFNAHTTHMYQRHSTTRDYQEISDGIRGNGDDMMDHLDISMIGHNNTETIRKGLSFTTLPGKVETLHNHPQPGHLPAHDLPPLHHGYPGQGTHGAAALGGVSAHPLMGPMQAVTLPPLHVSLAGPGAAATEAYEGYEGYLSTTLSSHESYPLPVAVSPQPHSSYPQGYHHRHHPHPYQAHEDSGQPAASSSSPQLFKPFQSPIPHPPLLSSPALVQRDRESSRGETGEGCVDPGGGEGVGLPSPYRKRSRDELEEGVGSETLSSTSSLPSLSQGEDLRGYGYGGVQPSHDDASPGGAGTDSIGTLPGPVGSVGSPLPRTTMAKPVMFNLASPEPAHWPHGRHGQQHSYEDHLDMTGADDPTVSPRGQAVSHTSAASSSTHTVSHERRNTEGDTHVYSEATSRKKMKLQVE